MLPHGFEGAARMKKGNTIASNNDKGKKKIWEL